MCSASNVSLSSSQYVSSKQINYSLTHENEEESSPPCCGVSKRNYLFFLLWERGFIQKDGSIKESRAISFSYLREKMIMSHIFPDISKSLNTEDLIANFLLTLGRCTQPKIYLSGLSFANLMAEYDPKVLNLLFGIDFQDVTLRKNLHLSHSYPLLIFHWENSNKATIEERVSLFLKNLSSVSYTQIALFEDQWTYLHQITLENPRITFEFVAGPKKMGFTHDIDISALFMLQSTDLPFFNKHELIYNLNKFFSAEKNYELNKNLIFLMLEHLSLGFIFFSKSLKETYLASVDEQIFLSNLPAWLKAKTIDPNFAFACCFNINHLISKKNEDTAYSNFQILFNVKNQLLPEFQELLSVSEKVSFSQLLAILEAICLIAFLNENENEKVELVFNDQKEAFFLLHLPVSTKKSISIHIPFNYLNSCTQLWDQNLTGFDLSLFSSFLFNPLKFNFLYDRSLALRLDKTSLYSMSQKMIMHINPFLQFLGFHLFYFTNSNLQHSGFFLAFYPTLNSLFPKEQLHISSIVKNNLENKNFILEEIFNDHFPKKIFEDILNTQNYSLLHSYLESLFKIMKWKKELSESVEILCYLLDLLKNHSIEDELNIAITRCIAKSFLQAFANENNIKHNQLSPERKKIFLYLLKKLIQTGNLFLVFQCLDRFENLFKFETSKRRNKETLSITKDFKFIKDEYLIRTYINEKKFVACKSILIQLNKSYGIEKTHKLYFLFLKENLDIVLDINMFVAWTNNCIKHLKILSWKELKEEIFFTINSISKLKHPITPELRCVLIEVFSLIFSRFQKKIPKDLQILFDLQRLNIFKEKEKEWATYWLSTLNDAICYNSIAFGQAYELFQTAIEQKMLIFKSIDILQKNILIFFCNHFFEKFPNSLLLDRYITYFCLVDDQGISANNYLIKLIELRLQQKEYTQTLNLLVKLIGDDYQFLSPIQPYLLICIKNLHESENAQNNERLFNTLKVIHKWLNESKHQSDEFDLFIQKLVNSWIDQTSRMKWAAELFFYFPSCFQNNFFYRKFYEILFKNLASIQSSSLLHKILKNAEKKFIFSPDRYEIWSTIFQNLYENKQRKKLLYYLNALTVEWPTETKEKSNNFKKFFDSWVILIYYNLNLQALENTETKNDLYPLIFARFKELKKLIHPFYLESSQLSSNIKIFFNELKHEETIFQASQCLPITILGQNNSLTDFLIKKANNKAFLKYPSWAYPFFEKTATLEIEIINALINDKDHKRQIEGIDLFYAFTQLHHSKKVWEKTIPIMEKLMNFLPISSIFYSIKNITNISLWFKFQSFQTLKVVNYLIQIVDDQLKNESVTVAASILVHHHFLAEKNNTLSEDDNAISLLSTVLQLLCMNPFEGFLPFLRALFYYYKLLNNDLIKNISKDSKISFNEKIHKFYIYLSYHYYCSSELENTSSVYNDIKNVSQLFSCNELYNNGLKILFLNAYVNVRFRLSENERFSFSLLQELLHFWEGVSHAKLSLTFKRGFLLEFIKSLLKFVPRSVNKASFFTSIAYLIYKFLKNFTIKNNYLVQNLETNDSLMSDVSLKKLIHELRHLEKSEFKILSAFDSTLNFVETIKNFIELLSSKKNSDISEYKSILVNVEESINNLHIFSLYPILKFFIFEKIHESLNQIIDTKILLKFAESSLKPLNVLMPLNFEINSEVIKEASCYYGTLLNHIFLISKTISKKLSFEYIEWALNVLETTVDHGLFAHIPLYVVKLIADHLIILTSDQNSFIPKLESILKNLLQKISQKDLNKYNKYFVELQNLLSKFHQSFELKKDIDVEIFHKFIEIDPNFLNTSLVYFLMKKD